VIGQVSSGYFTLCQVRSVYVRLDRVMSAYFSLCHVRTGYVRSFQIRPG
jgi:hypothetical protein